MPWGGGPTRDLSEGALNEDGLTDDLPEADALGSRQFQAAAAEALHII